MGGPQWKQLESLKAHSVGQCLKLKPVGRDSESLDYRGRPEAPRGFVCYMGPRVTPNDVQGPHQTGLWDSGEPLGKYRGRVRGMGTGGGLCP